VIYTGIIFNCVSLEVKSI